MHARVAFYTSRTGTFDEVVQSVEAPGGLLEIFRGRSGFQSYELIETGGGADLRVSLGFLGAGRRRDRCRRRVGR